MAFFFKSGTHFSASWTATRNEGLELENADSLTQVVEAEGISTIEGYLLSTGEVMSLSSPKYESKAIILPIMGTWCPNCRDEMEILREWVKREKPEDIEIIGLAFERPADTARVKCLYLMTIKNQSYENCNCSCFIISGDLCRI